MTKEMEQPYIQLPIPNYLPMEKPEFLEPKDKDKHDRQEDSDEIPRVIIIDI